LSGFIFPVCECGIVPVVSRLRKKGLSSGPVIAYLLSAPAFQPIVLFSTYSAFNNNFNIAFIRCGVSLAVAIIIACLFQKSEISPYLNYNITLNENVSGIHHDNHKHFENCPCCSDKKTHFKDEKSETEKKIVLFINTFIKESAVILSYLTIGAFLATLISYYNPVDLYGSGIEGYFGKIIEIFILMIMAVLMSVCSEADAFVAYSFTNFSLPAKMAFMWLGPIMDIKLIIMYKAVFEKKFVVKIFSVIFVVILFISIIFSVIYR